MKTALLSEKMQSSVRDFDVIGSPAIGYWLWEHLRWLSWRWLLALAGRLSRSDQVDNATLRSFSAQWGASSPLLHTFQYQAQSIYVAFLWPTSFNGRLSQSYESATSKAVPKNSLPRCWEERALFLNSRLACFRLELMIFVNIQRSSNASSSSYTRKCVGHHPSK